MISCIIVEDSPLAAEKLKSFISRVPSCNLLKTFDNGIDGLAYLQTNHVDLVFLDIQMEEFSGLQFMKSLNNHPKIIIVSAYSEYAIQGFENDVTDYLLKPYSFERFLKAIDKVYSELRICQKDFAFFKTEYRMERVCFNDILYVEGMGAYLKIITINLKLVSVTSFKLIESILPADNFIRVHKSYIVAINKIESIERNIIKISSKRIPIGKNYQKEFYLKISL